MDTRRKIQFYLNPETHEADNYANVVLDQTPQGERGRLMRAAMIGGFALQKLDPRLPFLLTELLNSNTSREEVMQLIRTIVLMPDSSIVSAVSAAVPPSTAQSVPAQSGADEELTRNNARGIL